MTSKKQDHFSAIRALLQRPPSETNWVTLLELFARHHPQIQEHRLLPYVRGHLQRWPDDLRAWQKPWNKRFLKGHYLPIAGLVTRLELRNRHLHEIDTERLHVHASYMTEVRHLTIAEESHLTLEQLQRWLKLPMFADIDSLSLQLLGIGTSEQAQAQFFNQRPLSALKSLSNDDHGVGFNTRSTVGILNGEYWPTLTRCALGTLTHKTFIAMQDQQLSPVLEHLTFSINASQDNWPGAPWLGTLKSLHLKQGKAHVVMDLLEHTTLTHLEELTLTQHPTTAILQSLLRNKSLTSLKTLNLKTWYTQSDLLKLLEAEHLREDLKEMLAARYIHR